MATEGVENWPLSITPLSTVNSRENPSEYPHYSYISKLRSPWRTFCHWPL